MDVKWYLPTSTPSYVVQSFVKHSQPRSLRGRQKEYITAFARYYFSKKPFLPPSDLSLLLFGDGERRGLVESCGAMKGLAGGGELRGSAVLSLELLLMLVDGNVNVSHGEEVLDVVVKAFPQPLSLRLLQSMHLHRHLSHPTSREFALKLIFILSESCPPLQRKEEWLGSAEAVRSFDEWQRGQLQAQSEAAAAAAAEDDDRELLSWAEVVLDDLDAEDLQVDAALAELIAEVDAEGEKEGGQKDPLGIARTLPSSASQAKGAVQTPAKIGKAAAKKMQILWKTMTKGTPLPLPHATSTEMNPTTSVTAGTSSNSNATSPPPLTGSSSPLMGQVMSHGSSSTDREDFNPVVFLSQVHSSSSLEALQRGLLHLQKSVNNRAAAMKSLVAEHFGQYVFCLDTIEHLHQLMKSEVNEKSSRAIRIGSALHDLNRQCEAAYGGVISAKRGSDRMRETLQTLQQFHFLFSLPGEVTQHSQQKQYSQVVRDYKKAKAIIITPQPQQTPSSPAQPSHPPTPSGASSAGGDLPSLVLLEVFKRVSSVRSALFRQLESAHLPLDEQVRAIQLLTELDCDIDPAWYFLQRQIHHIGREMETALNAAIDRTNRQAKGTLSPPLLSSPHQHSPLSPSSSPLYGDTSSFSVTSNGDPSQLNGHSAELPPPLLLNAPWNPFGGLLALNPSLLSSSSPSLWPSLASPTDSPPLSSTSSSPSSAVDSASASAVFQFIQRLCSLLTQSIPSFLRLAHLIATRQLTTGGGTGGEGGRPLPVNGLPATSPRGPSTLPLSSPSSPSTGLSSSLPPLPLQGVSAEHRQAIHALLDGLFHQFSAYVRLALFPVTTEELQRWETAGPVKGTTEMEGKGGSGAALTSSSSSPPLAGQGVTSPMKGGSASSASSSPSTAPSPLSVERLVDKSTEHGPFSFNEPPSPSSHLPLLDPPSVPSSLPLPFSTHQVVHLLLRAHSQMLDLGLSSESLHHLNALRVALVRWFVARTVAHTKGAIESLQGEETWELIDDRPQGRRRGGGGRRGRSTASSPSSSSSRRTALPSRFHSLMRSALTSLTAIPSIKAHWMIKAIAGPLLDCMKTFALTITALLHTLEGEDRGEDEVVEEEEVEEDEGRGREGGRGSSQLSGGMAELPRSSFARPLRRPRVSVALLLLLSNVRYVRSVVLPSVLTELLSLFPPSTHSVVRDAFSRSVLPPFDELDGRLLQHFLRLHLLTLHRRIRDEAYNPSALLFHLHTKVEGGGGEDGQSGPSSAGSGHRRPAGPRPPPLGPLLPLPNPHSTRNTTPHSGNTPIHSVLRSTLRRRTGEHEEGGGRACGGRRRGRSRRRRGGGGGRLFFRPFLGWSASAHRLSAVGVEVHRSHVGRLHHSGVHCGHRRDDDVPQSGETFPGEEESTAEQWGVE